MPQRKRRRSARDDILRVFADLVAEQGYSDVSIGEVADQLGMSKGTIVHHFSPKIQLLVEVHTSYMERRLAEAHEILGTVSTPTGQLAAMVFALLRSHRDDRAATIAFLREIVRFTDGDAMAAVQAQRDTYTALVEGIIRRGVEQGEFETEDTRLVMLQVFGMCNYAWTWYRPDGPTTSEEIARVFIRTILIGLEADDSDHRDRIDEIVREAIAAVNRSVIK